MGPYVILALEECLIANHQTVDDSYDFRTYSERFRLWQLMKIKPVFLISCTSRGVKYYD
jgi:hypothetical protein